MDGGRVLSLVICGVDVCAESWCLVELLRKGDLAEVRVRLLAWLVRTVVASVEVP